MTRSHEPHKGQLPDQKPWELTINRMACRAGLRYFLTRIFGTVQAPHSPWLKHEHAGLLIPMGHSWAPYGPIRLIAVHKLWLRTDIPSATGTYGSASPKGPRTTRRSNLTLAKTEFNNLSLGHLWPRSRRTLRVLRVPNLFHKFTSGHRTGPCGWLAGLEISVRSIEWAPYGSHTGLRIPMKSAIWGCMGLSEDRVCMYWLYIPGQTWVLPFDMYRPVKTAQGPSTDTKS